MLKKYRNISYYITTLAFFSALIYLLIQKGKHLELGTMAIKTTSAVHSHWQQFIENFTHNLTEPLSILLLQIILIIAIARIFGWLCKKVNQPTVVGEILAGVLLGPSLVGHLIPGFSAFMFPVQSLPNLNFLSQIGLILFMFVVGMELDINILKHKAKDAVIISHASIIFPFTLGIVLAYFIYGSFSSPGINFLSFALFIGISMSITAFPVLARIVQERSLSKTRLGAIAITCAAADDITAWCILAAVIAIVKAGSVIGALYTIIMAILYVLVMLRFIRPLFKKMGDKYAHKEALNRRVVGIFFLTLLVSSFTTEVIGIHALFGAFMAGVIMPQNVRFRSIFIEKVEDVAQVLLLPLFFVFTGLRTEIGLLNEPYLWKICLIIIGVAIAGKFLGSALSAKFVGQSWHESLSIGALMNTRGLMELIALNIGYDLGVLNPKIFTMLVIMALITTCLTGPALNLINRVLPEKSPDSIPEALHNRSKYRMLLAFNNPDKGVGLLKLAVHFIKNTQDKSLITLLHLTPSNEINRYNLEEYQRECFGPIEQESQNLNIPVTCLFKPSLNIEAELVSTANEGHFDLLLINIGQSVFEGTLLGKIWGVTHQIINPERLFGTITRKEKLIVHSIFDERTKHIVRASDIPVGIFIDKALFEVKNVFIPIFSLDDSFLLIFARKLIHHSQCKVIVMDVMGIIGQNHEFKEAIRSIEQIAPHHIALYHDRKIEREFLSQQDLMMISFESWETVVNTKSIWLSHIPSTLILKV